MSASPYRDIVFKARQIARLPTLALANTAMESGRDSRITFIDLAQPRTNGHWRAVWTKASIHTVSPLISYTKR